MYGNCMNIEYNSCSCKIPDEFKFQWHSLFCQKSILKNGLFLLAHYFFSELHSVRLTNIALFHICTKIA
jgi:hypothetical protein